MLDNTANTRKFAGKENTRGDSPGQTDLRNPDWIERCIQSPSDCPSDWVTQVFRFGSYAIRLTKPRDPDRLLDDAAVQCESQRNDYMPYWAYVWPGALLLAEHMVALKWPAGARAVEIGCGLGLAGLAALSVGLHVTFTDYTPAAVELAKHNAAANGWDRFAGCHLDWNGPFAERFGILLGADVLYEPRCLDDVLRVIEGMLEPGGLALLSDPDRAVADRFADLAEARGFPARCIPIASGPHGDKLFRGRIFEIGTHPDSRDAS